MLRHGVDGGGEIYVSAYGYTAIFIAWLGRKNPIGTALAAFFLAAILVGTQSVVILGLPIAIVSAVVGAMLVCLTGGAILGEYKITFDRGKGGT